MKIGTLTKTHGVGGELNFVFTDDVWDRADADYLMVKVDGLLVPFFIDEYRFRNDTTAIVKFTDIDSEADARELVGAEVHLEHSQLPDGITPEYSWSEFVGLTIIDSDSEPVGTITEVDDSTENVLFTVGKHLIPAAEELIEEVDWEHGTIKMTIPEGIFEL